MVSSFLELLAALCTLRFNRYNSLILFILEDFLGVLVFTLCFANYIAEHVQLPNLVVVFSFVVLGKCSDVAEVLSTQRTDENIPTYIVISDSFFKSVAEV